jgi:putative oxidoreductase
MPTLPIHDLSLPYGNEALLLLRLMIAAIFGFSGWSHVTKPAERAKSIGMSKPFTVFLGSAEVAGALGILFGVLAGWAALGLILVMLGAIYKKAFEWKTGFWGKGNQGWHYDLIMIVMCLIVMTVGPGAWVLFH